MTSGPILIQSSALNFLTDTNRFLTFSGSAGVEFQWDVAEARGTGASVTTEGSFEDGWPTTATLASRSAGA